MLTTVFPRTAVVHHSTLQNTSVLSFSCLCKDTSAFLLVSSPRDVETLIRGHIRYAWFSAVDLEERPVCAICKTTRIRAATLALSIACQRTLPISRALVKKFFCMRFAKQKVPSYRRFYFFLGGQRFPIPPPVFENLLPPSFAITMMLCEKQKQNNRP